MSTYWTYKCNTCNVECGERGNRIDKVLLDILKMSDHFKQIRDADSKGYIEFRIIGNHPDLIEFIIEHYTHDIIVLSEYGDYITKDGVEHKKDEINRKCKKCGYELGSHYKEELCLECRGLLKV